MNKMNVGLMVYILISIVLGGCDFHSDNEDVILLKEARLSVLKTIDYFTLTPQDELLDRVFLLAANSKQYVIFYRMNINEKSVSYHVSDSVLEIRIETNTSINEKTYIYELIKPKVEGYDTINVIKDGEQIPVSTYIIN